MLLQRRLLASAYMPNGQDLEGVFVDGVVDEVADPTNEKTTHSSGSSAFIRDSDSWFASQQCERFADVNTNCSWRGRTILCPPLSRTTNLRCRTR